MSADPKNRVTQLPITTLPEILKATPIEEDIEKLQFRGQPETAPQPEVKVAERRADDTNRVAVDGSLRTAAVMKALFPDGVRLSTDEDFAAYRILDRLVAEVAHFAQTGMRRQAPLRDIALHASVLESVISKDKR